MSHTIRSKTYMQVASRERGHRAQIAQVAFALLVLLSLLFWNQIGQPNELGASHKIQEQEQVEPDATTVIDFSNGL